MSKLLTNLEDIVAALQVTKLEASIKGHPTPRLAVGLLPEWKYYAARIAENIGAGLGDLWFLTLSGKGAVKSDSFQTGPVEIELVHSIFQKREDLIAMLKRFDRSAPIIKEISPKKAKVSIAGCGDVLKIVV